MFYGLISSAQVKRYIYHDSDQENLKEVYEVKDTISNILNGRYTSFYLNGNKESEGKFSDNETIGQWHFYYETGKLKMSGTLKPNSNDGYWEYYYENGNKSMEGEISQSKRRGEWLIYYESGELKEKGLFRNNKREGLWLKYFEDQKLKGETKYFSGKGQMIEYYPTGEKRAIGLMIGVKSEGEWQYFYKDGKLQAKGEYKNNQKIREWVYFYKSGELSASGNFQSDMPHGEWNYFFEDGSISSKGAFIDGEKSGYWGMFYENGSLKGESTLVNGDGNYKEYYKSGKLKIKGQIIDNKSDSTWSYFYENGSLSGKCEFDDGKGKYIGYYPDGTIQTKGVIEDGQKVDKWELYNRKGILSGYYKPIYDEYGVNQDYESPKPQRKYGVADYRFKNNNFRHFKPKINEYKGVIIGINPLAILIGKVPFAVEFYIQERLGHEFEFEALRNPFFDTSDNVAINDVFSSGYSTAIKQKFYNDGGAFGLWYFGHEIRFTNLSHFSSVESTLVPDNSLKVSASEQKIEYSILLGYRFMGDTKSKGITIDTFIGLGTGYRSFDEPAEYQGAFEDLNQSKVTFRPSFGITFGYMSTFGRRGR